MEAGRVAPPSADLVLDKGTVYQDRKAQAVQSRNIGLRIFN